MLAAARRALWKARMRFKNEGRSFHYLRKLNAWQWLPAEEIRRVQKEHLTELLRHAAAHVPYYAELLRGAGVVDEVGRVGLDAFEAVPLLDKATIRGNFEHLQSGDLPRRKWYYNTSGGSTGEPVKLIQDARYNDWGTALKYFYDGWTGYSIGRPKIRLWGSERDLFVGREPWNVRVSRLIRNEKALNTFRMTDDRIAEYIREINETKPTQILAYVESAYELARKVEREGLGIHSPRAVMTSAGTLQPHMREVIERVFQAPVFNRYGSREVGDIACQCEKTRGLHISAPTHFIEILRQDGSAAKPGEVGEVVVTLLTNYAMPLIRYRIGDLAAWSVEPCSCGRGFPVLENVVGRTNSMIRTRSQTFDSAAISTLLYYKDAEQSQLFGSFSRYQFIQKSLDHMLVRVVVRSPSEWPDERRAMERKLKAAFGPDVDVRIEEVDDIPPSKSGKFAYVVSELEG